MQDGTLVYRIRTREGADANKVVFTIGLIVRDEALDGRDIQDAVSVSVGSCTGEAFTAAAITFGVKIQPKGRFTSSFSPVAQNAEIGKGGNGPATTDIQGKYLLSNVQPGIYNLVEASNTHEYQRKKDEIYETWTSVQ